MAGYDPQRPRPSVDADLDPLIGGNGPLTGPQPAAPVLGADPDPPPPSSRRVLPRPVAPLDRRVAPMIAAAAAVALVVLLWWSRRRRRR